MAITTTYGGGGGVNTSMDLRGLDIGPKPDFWSDFNRVRSRLTPPRSAMDQGQALTARDSGPAPRRAYDWDEGMQYTGRSFGRPSMSPQGVIGTYINPADVPLKYRGMVPTGFTTDDSTSNYTYSPTVDPVRYGQATSGTSRR